MQDNLNALEKKREIICDAYYKAPQNIQSDIQKEIQECLKGRALRDTALEWVETCGSNFPSISRLEINPEIYLTNSPKKQQDPFSFIFDQIFPLQNLSRDFEAFNAGAILTKRTVKDFSEDHPESKRPKE